MAWHTAIRQRDIQVSPTGALSSIPRTINGIDAISRLVTIQGIHQGHQSRPPATTPVTPRGHPSVGVAHADANSYLDYLASHHIATGLNTPGFNVSAGLHACEMLHAGLTPQQVGASDPTAIGVDIPGLVDAAA